MSAAFATLAKYFDDFKENTDALNEKVYHCASRLTIYLGETKTYYDGRCMLTKKHMIWRNQAHSPLKRQRISFALKHIKAITIKSGGKLAAFSAQRLLIYLNEFESNAKSTSSQRYIQLAFNGPKDSRNKFAKQLQTIIGTDNDGGKEHFETLKNILTKEDIIDEIHEKYIKITVSEFSSAIQTLYYIQGYSTTQNTVKYQNMKHASDIITKIVKYDNATHNLKLTAMERTNICKTYFNYEPYLEISNPKQFTAGNSYTSYHCNRFIDINMYIFSLFSEIFPIKCSLETQQQWIETILRCTWYIEESDKSDKLILSMIDRLITQIWKVKFIPMDNINVNDKCNLLIVRHILSKYCHCENIPNECQFKDLTQTFLSKRDKKGYDKYLIDILNIKALQTRFTAESVHRVMIELVTLHSYGKSDYVILELIKYIKGNISSVNGGSTESYLDLQLYLRGVIDEDEALTVIELNLLINYKLIYLKWSQKYNGLNSIEYAKAKEVKPKKIIAFLKNKMETMDQFEIYNSENEQKLAETINVSHVSGLVTVDLEQSHSHTDMHMSAAVMDCVQSVQKSIAEWKGETNETLQELLALMRSGNSKEESKESDNINIEEEMKECKQELLDSRDWKNWSYLEVVQYLIGVDNAKFAKYKSVLFQKMKYREIKGTDLAMMEKADLTHFFGIVNYGDVCGLWKEIKALMETESESIFESAET